MNLSLLRNAAVYILFIVLLVSCAGQVAPQGGPVDTTPPAIISTFPSLYTTKFSGDKIVLEFDEYVDHRSVEESIFISPNLGALEFDWSGTEVTIRFAEKLRPNATYVVNVGTDVNDVHNRNRMAQAFTLAFSTGETIDRGAIEGKVYPQKAGDQVSGVMVFAYNLGVMNPDTLNPQHTRPDYITQTGKDGAFFFRHLSFGSYRIFAVKDEYRNLLYDPEIDEVGVPSKNIALTPDDTLQTNVTMQLSIADTTAPRLLKVAPQDRRHLLVEFSEPMDTSTVSQYSFFIGDTVKGNVLNTLAVAPVLPSFSKFLVLTDEQIVSQPYKLFAQESKDLSGHAVNPIASALGFNGGSHSDSLPPTVSAISIRDSARNVELQPRIQIFFSDILQKEQSSKSVLLQDSIRAPIPVSIRWLSNAAMEITPSNQLMPLAWYKLTVELKNLLTQTGRKGKDTLRTVAFQTLDPEMFSSIEGILIDNNRSDTTGAFHLFVENIVQKNSTPYLVTLRKQGKFEFKDVTEGQYILHAFRDRNENKKYDAGQPYPFKQSERFVNYPDTLKVRARWPLEGVRLIFR
ncbi:MAG: Ig-like domain-containing protein [Ignavibacteriales bacterium]|nr:Ig-like domain-containing protein [Ignavibacteriales bacterium]